MPTVSEPKNLGDVLKYEADSLYSRDAGIVASGQNLTVGTVLGKKTADGKLYALAPAATDGTQTAMGVLANDVDATSADNNDAVVIVRHAIVARNALIWPSGITDPQKSTAVSQLAAIGVLVRDSA